MKKNYSKQVDTAREMRLWLKEVIIPLASMLAMVNAFKSNGGHQNKHATKGKSYHQDFIVMDD